MPANNVDGKTRIAAEIVLDAKQVLDAGKKIKKDFEDITKALDGAYISDSLQEAINTMQDLLGVSQDVFDSIEQGNEELVADGADLNNQLRQQLETVYDESIKSSEERIHQLQLEQQQEALVNAQIDRTANTIRTVAGNTLNNMRRITTGLGRLLRQIARVGAAVIKSGLSRLGSIFFGGSRGADSFHSRLKQGVKMVLSYALGIASLNALFGKLKSAAAETFQRMAQQIPEVNRDISALKNSFQNLKNSIGTMFQPLLAALTPLITKIVNGLTAVIDKIAQFIAALTGQKYIYKATNANIDYAKSLDKNTKSQKKNNKETEKALGTYDKLLVIQKQNADNADQEGAYNPEAAMGTFKKVPVDPKWLKIADWLKDMWKTGDFFALGAKVAEMLKNLLKSIPWNKIQAFMAKLGKSIATFFNGIFADLELARELGNAVAQAFNSLLTFAYNFVHWFDAMQFGKFVGTAIVEGLQNINWDMLHDFAKELGTKIADAINGLVGTGVIAEIGNAIGHILRAAIDFVFNMISSDRGINFDEIAKQLVQGLRNIFARMNEVDETGLNGWQKAGKALSDAVIGILHTINTVLSDETLRSNVAKAITDFFNSIDFKTIFAEATDLIANIASGIWIMIKAAFASENFREDFAPVVTRLFLAIFGISLLTSIGQFVASNFISALVQGLAESWVASGITTTATTAATGAVEAAGAAATTSATGAIAETGAAATTSALGVAGQFVAAIATFFAGAELGKTIGAAIFPDDAELYEHYQGISGTFKLLKDTLSTMGSQLWEFFTNVGNGIVNGVKKAIDWVVSAFSRLNQMIANSRVGQFLLNSGGTTYRGPVRTTAGAGSKIPGLAKGAVIPPNREFLATLGDQKSGTNIETPLNTMIEAFKTALSEMGGGSSNNQPIVLQLDGRTVAQTVWSEEDKRYKQTGQYRPRTV